MTNFLGTVLDKDIKGIRIRQGNILIGDENTLRKCYKEERFNSWMVGELLVFNEDIIPNTRRDDYEKIVPIKNCLVSSRNGLMKCQGRYVTDLTKEV